MQEATKPATADAAQRKYLDPRAAARYLCLAPATLAKWRTEGRGPIHRRFGGRIRYAVADLDAWADAGARTSTSDEGAAA